MTITSSSPRRLGAERLLLLGLFCTALASPAAAQFTFDVRSPNFRVSIPSFPQLTLGPHPLASDQRPHLRYLGSDGPFNASVLTPTADPGMTGQECASSVITVITKRMGLSLEDVYRVRTDESTYVAVYVIPVREGVVQLNAQLVASVGGHCVQVHVSKISRDRNDVEPWFRGFSDARITPLAEATSGSSSVMPTAPEASYSCRSEKGCREEPGPTYGIGRGATITLPSGWTFYSYPTAPIPIMAGLREVRAFKGSVVIAITPLPNVDQRTISEAFLCDVVTKSSQDYVRHSKEQKVTAVPMSHGDVVGCHVALRAMNDGERPFGVLPNRRHASVTSFAIAHKYIIFSVSVVSERPPDDDYLAAVTAIRQLQ